MENRQGEVKNNIGVHAELVCTTHGHELRVGVYGWERVCKVEGNERGEMEQLQ